MNKVDICWYMYLARFVSLIDHVYLFIHLFIYFIYYFIYLFLNIYLF